MVGAVPWDEGPPCGSVAWAEMANEPRLGSEAERRRACVPAARVHVGVYPISERAATQTQFRAGAEVKSSVRNGGRGDAGFAQVVRGEHLGFRCRPIFSTAITPFWAVTRSCRRRYTGWAMIESVRLVRCFSQSFSPFCRRRQRWRSCRSWPAAGDGLQPAARRGRPRPCSCGLPQDVRLAGVAFAAPFGGLDPRWSCRSPWPTSRSRFRCLPQAVPRGRGCPPDWMDRGTPCRSRRLRARCLVHVATVEFLPELIGDADALVLAAGPDGVLGDLAGAVGIRDGARLVRDAKARNGDVDDTVVDDGSRLDVSAIQLDGPQTFAGFQVVAQDLAGAGATTSSGPLAVSANERMRVAARHVAAVVFPEELAVRLSTGVEGREDVVVLAENERVLVRTGDMPAPESKMKNGSGNGSFHASLPVFASKYVVRSGRSRRRLVLVIRRRRRRGVAVGRIDEGQWLGAGGNLVLPQASPASRRQTHTRPGFARCFWQSSFRC